MHGACKDGATLDANWPANVGREQEIVSVGQPNQMGRDHAAVVIESPNGLYQQTELVTIGCDLEIPNPPVDVPGDELLDVIGILGYGVGGARHEAEFDWRAGLQITVPCSRVDVRAFFQPNELQDPIRRARLRCSLSYGTRPTRQLVTRSSPRTVVGAGAEVLFVMPRLAYAVNFAFDALGAYAVTTTFRARGGLTVTSPILLELDGIDLREALRGEGVHLPGATRSVTISNAAAGAIIARAVWALGL